MTDAEHRLRLVQAQLRGITGTPIKDEVDRLRRMSLWRELDELVRARDTDNHPFRHQGGKPRRQSATRSPTHEPKRRNSWEMISQL
jgi:hypothetical protein